MEAIKLILTDIDGVWTDGGMLYDNTDLEFKKFNTRDSGGVLFARELGIPVGIMTGEDTRIVARRAEKLKLDIVHQGVHKKLDKAQEILSDLGLDWKDLAYIGDDLIDLPVLRRCGFSACPADAPDYIKREVDFITASGGGNGAFRDFVVELLQRMGRFEESLESIMSRLEA